MNVASTVVPVAVPFFTSVPSKRIVYDPLAISIPPITLTVSPTGPLTGSIETISTGEGAAVASGKCDAINVAASSIATKIAATLTLIDKYSCTRFPSFPKLFVT